MCEDNINVLHVGVDHAILAARAVKIYQTDKYQRCLSQTRMRPHSVEGPRRLPLLGLVPSAALDPVLPHAVDVLDEVALHAVHHLRELEPQPHLQQVGVLAYRVRDPGLHSVSESG